MSENPVGQPRDTFEERTHALFQDSVEGLEFAVRSRLTQARSAATKAASVSRRSWIFAMGIWTPAGVTAAAILGAFLWMGSPLTQHAVTVTDGFANLDDLEIVASTDEGAGDPMDMLQDDIDFYDWADKAAGSASAAEG